MFLVLRNTSPEFSENRVAKLDEKVESGLKSLRDFDIPISAIENVCSCLETSKAAGPDGIRRWMFGSNLLARICNLSSRPK